MALPPKLFDRTLIARHLARRPANRDDFITRLVLDDLRERLRTISRPFQQALILSPDGEGLPETGASADGTFAFDRDATVTGTLDPEALTLPRTGYDLIVSLFDLQVINDVPGFLVRLRAHLAADGLFLAAIIGGDSLIELREAFLRADTMLSDGVYARVAPFIPLQDVGGLLQRAGFALPVADVETHMVRYGAPLRLMSELKALGASNPLSERPGRMTTRGLLAAASAAYEDIAADPDGKVRATLDIVWMSGWAPHESQQQPLKPGSARISLTKVLGKPD